MRNILACIIIALLALSCQKVEVDSVYTVRVFIQERQSGERIPAEDVKVYAFAADTTLWAVASIEDARQGIITSRENPGEKLDNPETAEQYLDTVEGETVFNGKYRFATPFTQQNMMLVVAHGTQDIFAYGNAQLQYNLDRMEVTLVLELYRTDTEPYTQGLWRIYNMGTEVPVKCAYTVTSKQQRAEGSLGSTVPAVALNTARLHVFYLSEEDGTATDWRVASYNDAVNGVLTSRSNASDTRQAADVETEYIDNKATVTITQSNTVLLVYDTVQPMYAYAAANMVNNPETQNDEVTFKPYAPGTTESPEGERWTVTMGATRVSTFLTISPFSENGVGITKIPITTAKGYAFYTDSTEWRVASYEDALAGRITAREGSAVREADIEGQIAKYGTRIGLEMTQEEGHEKVMVVVCDTMLPMYAIAIIDPVKERWPEAKQVDLIFRPYLPDQTLPPTGSNIWTIRNGTTSEEEEEENEDKI